jgi:hypothetical protein
MPSNKDWLPFNHNLLWEQASTTKNYLFKEAVRKRLGFAPGTPQGDWLDRVFAPAFEHFAEAYKRWDNPTTRTRGATAALYEAEREFKPAYRHLYVGFLKNNPMVEPGDFVNMGLPVRSDGTRTAAPVPDSHPSVRVELPVLCRIVVHFFSREHLHHPRAKPAGVHGCELRWAILDAAPVNLAELRYSSFATRSPFTLDFQSTDRGKTLYFALCWENTRGKKGPFSSIQNVIIP